MSRMILLLPPLILLLGGGTCSSLPFLQTSVELVNNTGYTVEVQLFYHEEQDLPEDLIELDGTELNYSLAAGETRTFSRDCDDLQAIFIKDAEMLVAPGVSPEASTGVYREPDDFTCGNTITFTFIAASQTSLSIEFDRSN